MNLRTPCIALIVALSFVAGYASTQERTAPQPFSGPTDVTSPALMQKISYLTQLNHVLQADLNACRTGAPPPPPMESTVEDNGDFAPKLASPSSEDEATPSAPGATTHVTMNYTAPVAPNRRIGGAIQQASEPKLTCDDYSTSYFSRHPAMAAVCSRTNQVTEKAASTPATGSALPVTSTTTALVSATTRVSGTSAVSSTLRVRTSVPSSTTPASH